MLSSTTVRATVVGSGSPGPFAFPFKVFAATDLLVQKTSAAGVVTPLAYPTDYTVPSGIGDASGGTLTLTVALVTGETLSILRAEPETQPTSLRTLGTFLPGTIEDALDRLTMLVQDHTDAIKRTARLRSSIDPASFSGEIPLPTANQALVCKADGTGWEARTVDTASASLLPSGRTAASLTAYLANNALFNVLDFGAKNDGASDNTALAAFQAAMNACNAAGGGVVFIPAGTFLFSTVTGPYKTFMRPRSNVRLVGCGAATILKAGNGLNTAVAGDGYAFIRHVADDESIATISDFAVENVTFDHNGTNNLVPAGNPNKTNIAVGIAAGSRIRVAFCRFLTNPGLQTLSFGNNTAPQSIKYLSIQNNYFQDQGGSVTGNTQSVDHSTIYAQADHVVISDNRFINANAQYKNTALEIHSSDGEVRDNTGINFAHAFNIVATVCNQQRMVYRGNKFTNVERGINFATASSFVMDDVLVEGNSFVQDANALTDLIDISTSVVTAITSLTIRGNRFETVTATGTTNTTSGVAIGLIKRLTLQDNKYKNIPGRAITMNVIDAALRLVIEREDIEDCGTTSNAGFQQGIALNSLTTVPFLRIAHCRVANVAGTYMTSAIGGTINVTKGEVVDNEISGVATEMNWSSSTTPPRISHRGAGAPGGLNVIAGVGSQWLRTDGGVSTTLYIKESGTTGAGWVAK